MKHDTFFIFKMRKLFHLFQICRSTLTQKI